MPTRSKDEGAQLLGCQLQSRVPAGACQAIWARPSWGRGLGSSGRMWGTLLASPCLRVVSRASRAPARSEVQKAVNTARGLYQRWGELLQEGAAVGREELDWTTNELRNSLRSIEWDLEDLEETIDIRGAAGRGGGGLGEPRTLGSLRGRGGSPGGGRGGPCTWLAMALTRDSGRTHRGSQPRQVQAPG